MYEYEWGNPSSVLFPPQTADPVEDGHHHHRHTAEGTYSHADTIDIPSFVSPAFLPLHHHSNNHFHSFPTAADPRGFPSGSYPPAPSSDDFDSPAAFFSLPKPGPDPPGYGSSAASLDRIGLNLGLGGRTYFSAAEEGGFLSRLYRHSRPFVDGGSLAANSPKCQVEGCNADLSNAKHYHRRHKVCDFHSKSSTVVAAGLTQRFCQQCSRFHLLTEFDNGKRSCRRRLADHNRRRRKSHRTDNVRNSPSCSENTPRSPSESTAHSVSSVTAAAVEESKPRSCYNSSEASPSVSSNSLFY